MFVAVTVDRTSRKVTHYLDGASVGHQVINDLPMLRIGDAEIGNWTDTRGDRNPMRSLNGSLDEFIVFDRALDASEVGALYQAGRPDLTVVGL